MVTQITLNTEEEHGADNEEVVGRGGQHESLHDEPQSKDEDRGPRWASTIQLYASKGSDPGEVRGLCTSNYQRGRFLVTS